MEELVAIKELWYVVLSTGGTDVDADFIVPCFEDLNALIFEKINTIEGIKNIETSLIMQYGKHSFVLPAVASMVNWSGNLTWTIINASWDLAYSNGNRIIFISCCALFW
jgi:hypothetical protein